jgi:hypothetical protein
MSANASPTFVQDNPTNVRAVAIAIGYLVVGVAAGYLLGNGSMGATVARVFDTRATASEWVRLPDGTPSLLLDHEAWQQQPQRHTSFVHPNGSRSDWALIGTLAEPESNAALQVVRRSEPNLTRNSLVQGLEELSDIKGSQRRYGSDYYVLTTRFGELRALSFVVIADGLQKSCLGFHRTHGGKLFLKGYVCSPDTEQVAPEAIACLLDRVRYVRPRDNEALATLLEKDVARPCGASLLQAGRKGPQDPSRERSL